MSARGKQIRFSIILVLLTVIFIAGGIYLMKHPIQFPERTNDGRLPAETYKPYEGVAPTIVEAQTAPDTVNVVTGGEAEEIARFYTTKRASIFTFSGLGNIAELNGVLEALRSTGSTATFFVTPEEMDSCADQISLIRLAGHSLGISIPPNTYANAAEMKNAILDMRTRLNQEYGVSERIFVRPTYGYASPMLRQAAGACGMQILSYVMEGVPEKVSRMTEVDDVLAVLYPDGGSLQRGGIMHFQMNMIQHSNRLLGELVERLVRDYAPYPVMSAADVANDVGSMYTYPLPEEDILPQVRDKVHPGYLEGKTDEEIFDVIQKGYLGIDWVSTKGFLPGFSSQEIKKLDKKGLIENDQNYVFLTFDDWGSDHTVEKLLTVLKKHNAKGTFFVRTQYVKYNPNLLRAIAAEGHTIGCHTHTHISESNEIDATHFEELSDQEVVKLRTDLVDSYQTLQSVVGDLRDEDGKPSLSLLFRPPTLAVGKNGLQTVFDCGFTHSISGYYTTADYKATSAEQLASEIKKKIKSGAVIVMHFSDNSIYTAEAMDIFMTELEQEGKDFKFVGLNAVY